VSWLIAGMCVDLSIQFTLMFWRPSSTQEYVLYILAMLWGITDGIWQTLINGHLFIYSFTLCPS